MKKFIFLSLTALLSVSVFLTGCSTEAEEKIVTVPGDQGPVVPDNAVRANSEAALRGLLGANSGVSVINYTSTAPVAVLTIPSGKTVYLNGNALTLTAHLAVASSAKVVVVKGLTTATAGKLLVNGTVEVASGATLAYNSAATEVTSYTESSGVITPGTATVIGDTGKVQVLKDGLLGLKTADVVATAAANKFTLAQAWSAAGSGHLSIDGDTAFPVSDLTALVTTTRGISATTTAVGALPGTIPALASITVKGAITDAGSDHKLTVNGSLETSGDSFTGAAITEIAVGDHASFETSSTGFSTAALTKITVGKGSNFEASGDADNATYALVTEITVGAGSSVTVGSDAAFAALATLSVGASAKFDASAATAPTYAALATLSVGDYAAANLALPTAATVTFKTADGLGTLTLGNHAVVDAGAAATVALVNADVAISNATVKGITLKAGKTITVAAGTLTVAATGITLKGASTAAKLVLQSGTTPAKLVSGGSDTTLGASGVITLTDGETLTGVTDANTLKSAGNAAALVAKGVTAATSTAKAFVSITTASTAEKDLILQAGTNQDSLIAATVTIGSTS